MKFKLHDASKFGWEGLEGLSYSSREDFAEASAARFKVIGAHGKVKSTSSNRVYLVLDGKGEFTINGVSEHVEKDDVIIVPKDTPYDYRAVGKPLELFLVHIPAYNPADEVQLAEGDGRVKNAPR